MIRYNMYQVQFSHVCVHVCESVCVILHLRAFLDACRWPFSFHYWAFSMYIPVIDLEIVHNFLPIASFVSLSKLESGQIRKSALLLLLVSCSFEACMAPMLHKP